MSLENHPAFYEHGIARCQPNWLAIGHLIAHAIIGDFPVPLTHNRFVRVSADMAHKNTTQLPRPVTQDTGTRA